MSHFAIDRWMSTSSNAWYHEADFANRHPDLAPALEEFHEKFGIFRNGDPILDNMRDSLEFAFAAPIHLASIAYCEPANARIRRNYKQPLVFAHELLGRPEFVKHVVEAFGATVNGHLTANFRGWPFRIRRFANSGCDNAVLATTETPSGMTFHPSPQVSSAFRDELKRVNKFGASGREASSGCPVRSAAAGEAQSGIALITEVSRTTLGEMLVANKDLLVQPEPLRIRASKAFTNSTMSW
jgi:hypothetical protein